MSNKGHGDWCIEYEPNKWLCKCDIFEEAFHADLNSMPEQNSDVRPQETVPNPAVRGDRRGSEGVPVASFSWTWEHFIKAIKCSIFGWPEGEVEKALEFAVQAKKERDNLRALLKRAIPEHYESTCWGYCMDGEPEKCGAVKLIKEIEEAIK